MRRLRAFYRLLASLTLALRERTARFVAADTATKAAALDGAEFWTTVAAGYWSALTSTGNTQPPRLAA